jgi:hypothetical protein
MTDYSLNEPVWVVQHFGDQANVAGALFLEDTEWTDRGVLIVRTTLGLARVTDVYKSSTDAQLSLQEK